MLCDWCGKSTTHYSHDRCWTDSELEPDVADAADPWAEILERWDNG